MNRIRSQEKSTYSNKKMHLSEPYIISLQKNIFSFNAKRTNFLSISHGNEQNIIKVSISLI